MAAATKMVYGLSEGGAGMEALLGGKGAHLSEMARIGIPVPAGFVITTEACLEFFRLGGQLPEGLWGAVVEGIHCLEEQTDRRLGDGENPLVVSVRSGAPVSMPGMMDTILNMGVVDGTVDGLARKMGDERAALDAYRRFIQGFGDVVLGVPKGAFEEILAQVKADGNIGYDYELGAEALRELIGRYKALILQTTGEPLAQDPWELLRRAIEAVLGSWNNPRAATYREFQGISHDLGTACVVMAMVFGNLGKDSGTGVMFSRSPATGERKLFGEFLRNAQGEDVVAGVRTPTSIGTLQRDDPDLYRQLVETAGALENHYGDVQDIEFTVESGKLYILQTRGAKRTALAAVKNAVDFVEEGVLTEEEALTRISAAEVGQILMPVFDLKVKQQAIEDGALVAQGLAGSPGAAGGIAVMHPGRAAELAGQGQRVVLVRMETSPDDVHGIIHAAGVLTGRGGMTSHAAVVTRGLGKPCVVGCEELQFLDQLTATARGKTFREGDRISIDGSTGEVLLGELPVVPPPAEALRDLHTLLGWADKRRTLEIWANADTPEDARTARGYGAEGIGLCRTEHMFFAPNRLPHIQKLLTAAPEAGRLIGGVDGVRRVLEKAPAGEREALQRQLADLEEKLEASVSVREFRKALVALEEFQTEDFAGILKAMEGLPVTIRLLDAPLHEFLPRFEDLTREVAVLNDRVRRGNDQTEETATLLAEKEQMLRLGESLREQNPMLGYRGCRVGITMPEIYDMQVRAILTAACRLAAAGSSARPEVMIPIVSHVNELRWLRPRLAAVAEETQRQLGVSVPYKFGTMIEVPRAALTAGDIAQEAEFFSFGSNDLTQMSFAYSRDDAEGKFLRQYVEQGILPSNPFTSLDAAGVGRLMRLAAEEGRAARHDLELGICGEHGGDPSSIAFCHSIGLDYVSASPFRVPVARLAAAQSALGEATT